VIKSISRELFVIDSIGDHDEFRVLVDNVVIIFNF